MSADGALNAVAGHRDGWCRASLTASWRRVLAQHVVPLSRSTSLQPFALAPDGRAFFTVVRSRSFSGVARVDVKTGALTHIRAFPDPRDDQAGGSFDGRWLVWFEYHSLYGLDDFTVWAWDSRTRRLSQIGAAAKARSGEFWPSPWGSGPRVLDGLATWVQGIGPRGLTAVHVYHLGAGVDRIVRRGHAQNSFLLAGHLVGWPESPAPGSETRIYLASTRTGRRVAAPAALRPLRGISGLSSDGRQIAYPSAPFKSLWWAPSLRRAPTEILAARGVNHIDNSIQVGGRYIGFSIQGGLFLADTKARRYIEIEHEYGWTELDDRSLLVDYGDNTKKTLNYLATVVLVPLRDLPPTPPCTSPRRGRK